MTQPGRQPFGPTESTQQTGQGGQGGQGGTQAGKVTWTSTFPLEETAGVPAEVVAAAEGSGKNQGQPAAEGAATAPGDGAAPSGPMQGPAGAPGSHAIPTDEFLKVLEPTRLMLLTSDVTKPEAPTPWEVKGPGSANGGGEETAGSLLQQTNVILDANAIIRAAIHADAAKRVPGYRYVTNAPEQFGWVPEASVAPATQKAEPVAGAEDLDEEVPLDEMPELSAQDYDQLFALTADAVVYVRPTASMDQLTTASTMEMVVAMGEPVEIEKRWWQQVKLVRQPPVIGWLLSAQGYEVASDQATSALGSSDLSLSWRQESNGPPVLELEQRLSALGFSPGSVDETFDESTDKAVRAFQLSTRELEDKSRWLDADGEVGPLTAAELERAAEERAAQSGGGGGGGKKDDDDDAAAALATGTWVGGYSVGEVHPAATTPTGAASSAGYSLGPSGTNSKVTGACEVLHSAGDPVTSQSGKYVDWYIRGVDGGAGWVHSNEVKPTQTADGEAVEGTETDLVDELAALCPNGVTVAFVTQFTERELRQFDTFSRTGTSFAAQHHAVALSAGQLVTGSVNYITHKEQIVGILASIQQSLRGGAAELPAWARIAHLAFFTHGSWTRKSGNIEYGGLQTDGDAWEEDGTMHNSDLEGFARTLTAFCTSDVEVSLYACSTGVADQTGTAETAESIGSKGERQQTELKGGEAGFADLLSDELVAAGATDAMTMGHTTVAHTTQNPNARLFTGAEDGGVNLYNWVFLPFQDWMATELADFTASGYAQPGKEQEVFGGYLFSWYRGEILDDPDLATRMSTDPEIFKVELRERAITWAHSQYERWGVRNAADVAAGVAYFAPGSDSRPPVYLDWSDVQRAQIKVEIPYGTRITSTLVEVRVQDLTYYPITWEGDPYGPESATPIQAYAPKSWVSRTEPKPRS